MLGNRLLVDAQLGPLLTGILGPEEDVLLHDAARQRGVEDAGIHLLVETWHGHHHRGPNLLEVLRHRVDGFRVGDRGAGVEHRVVTGHALEDVAQRQKGERRVPFIDAEGAQRGQHVADDVPVAQYHTLGIAGGTGCIDDAAGLSRLHGTRALLERLRSDVDALGAALQELAHHDHAFAGRLAAELDDVLERLHACLDLQNLAGLDLVLAEDGPALGVVQDEGDLLWQKRRIHRNIDPATEEDAEIGHGPF